jgi:hypothetical protein
MVRGAVMGLMTGTGYGPLLHSVMSRFLEATDSEQLLGIIAEEQERVTTDARFPVEQRQKFVDETGWLVTANGNAPILAYYKSRVDSDPSRAGHTFFEVMPRCGAVWLSENEDELPIFKEVHDGLTARLNAEIRMCGADEKIVPSITYHIALMRSVLDEGARRMPATISRCFDIGVHAEGGLCEIYRIQ